MKNQSIVINVKVLIALVLVIGLVLGVGTMAVVRADTLEVNGNDPDCADDGTGSSYCTIQAAIDAASPHDTINVVAGTYNETITFDAGFDKDALTISGDASNRPVVTGGVRFLQTATLDGLILENLYIEGVATGGNGVFDMDNSGVVNDFTMDNCVIDGENTSGRSGFLGQNLGQSFTITNSEFKNILSWAVMDIDSGSGDGGNSQPLDTVTFANNYVHDSNGSVALRGNATDRTDVVNVYGNTWDNIGGNEGETGEQWAAFEINHADTANVYDNSVNDVQLGEWGEGQALQLWDIGTLDVHNNDFTNNAQGIFIFGGSAGGTYGGPYAVPGGSIYENRIAGNMGYGINVDPAATGGPLDATGNWWGYDTGPTHTLNPVGIGDSVSDNVAYSPWMGIGIDASPAPGFQTASSMTYIVGQDVCLAVGCIQQAVNLASEGDVVLVLTGLFHENVVVDKSLILTAVPGASPIIDGDTDGDTVPDGDTVTIAADQVVIDGFEIRNGYDGIAGETSQSAITNNVIHDNLNIPGSAGVGILLWGGSNKNAIQGNEIFNNDRQGIFLGFSGGYKCDDIISNDNLISHNTIYDNGLYREANGPDESEYGIQLLNADGSIIEHNEIFGHNDWDFGHGIYLVASDGNGIFDNDIHDNNYGVSVDLGSADNYLAGNIIHDHAVNGLTILDEGSVSTLANFNQFCRNAEYGVQNAGFTKCAVEVDATYNWWGSASGPGPVGPGTGDNVSDNVNFWPWDNVPPTDGPCHINSIHVQKYEDLDGSGDKSDDEPGLNGWSVTLYDDQGQEVMSDATHTVGYEDGWVLFEDLPPGDYTVCETLKDDWINSDPGADPPCKSITITDYGRGPGSGPLFTFIDHPGDDEYRLVYLGVDTWGLDVIDLNDESLRDRLSEPWLCLLERLVELDPGTELGPDFLDPHMLIEWDVAEGFDDGLYYLTIESEYFEGPIELGVKTWRGSSGYSTATGFIECGGAPTVLFGNYQLGSITIVKEARGAKKSDEFTFTGDLGDFTLTRYGSQDFPDQVPGYYTVAEDPTSFPDEYWALLSVTCKDEGGDPVAGVVTDLDNFNATIPLQSGQHLICTFLNERADLEVGQQYQCYLPLIMIVK